MGTDYNKKRKYPRLLITENMWDEKPAPFKDKLKNISGNGCLLLSEKELELGDKYEVEIVAPNKKHIVRTGEVVWKGDEKVEDDGKKYFGYGLKFLEKTRSDAAQIVDVMLCYKIAKYFSEE